jgi:F0F1-type ATP synthase membrane subunit c/vacuolar-type H+-ATPase subunit K
MTESASQVLPAPKPSFWEDLIDIFIQPAAVFRRRENSSVWPPMLFVAIAIGIIVFATFGTLEPIFDAEFTRNTAKALAKNPGAAQASPEMMNKIRGFGEATAKYGVAGIMLITMFVVGCVSWLVGKLFSSKQTFQAALVVAAWAYMPRVLGALINGIQGLLMDPASLTGQMSISLSPARFMDPEASGTLLYQLAGRLDLITIWVTVLLGVGLYVTGKVPKGRAAVFAVTMWIVGSLPAIKQAMM